MPNVEVGLHGRIRPSVQTFGAVKDEPSHSIVRLFASYRPQTMPTFFSFLFYSNGDLALRDETCECVAVKTKRSSNSEEEEKAAAVHNRLRLLVLPEVHRRKECRRREKLRV